MLPKLGKLFHKMIKKCDKLVGLLNDRLKCFRFACDDDSSLFCCPRTSRVIPFLVWICGWNYVKIGFAAWGSSKPNDLFVFGRNMNPHCKYRHRQLVVKLNPNDWCSKSCLCTLVSLMLFPYIIVLHLFLMYMTSKVPSILSYNWLGWMFCCWKMIHVLQCEDAFDDGKKAEIKKVHTKKHQLFALFWKEKM